MGIRTSNGRIGRKTDLVVQIQIARCMKVGRDKAVESTRGYIKKSAEELVTILRTEWETK